MKIRKFVPWMTHRAAAAPPRAVTLRAGATRQAADDTVRCTSTQHSDTAFERIDLARICLPGRRLDDARLPDIIRYSFVQKARRTIAADPDLLPERC